MGFSSMIILIISVISLANASSQINIYGNQEVGTVINLETSSPLGDSNWTGTNTFEDDVIFEGEISGSYQSFQLGSKSANLNSGGTAEEYMYVIADNPIQTSNQKGIIMKEDGSIMGMTLQYDITSITGTGFGKTLRSEITINGNALLLITQSCTASVGSELTCIADYDRGTYTFNSGDDIQVKMRTQGIGGTSIIDIDDMIMTLNVIYDD